MDLNVFPRRRGNLVAFGAKRTWPDMLPVEAGSKMTQSGQNKQTIKVKTAAIDPTATMQSGIAVLR